MEEEYIKEKELINAPKAIPINVLEILISKAKTQICKIECNNGGHGTGFFCNILYNYNIIKVLITNNHVLNEDDILKNKTIKFSLNNDKQFYEIIMDGLRESYTSEKYDITIIQIKETDKLDIISFFDIDNEIFNDDFIDKYKNKHVYLLHYPKGMEMELSNGLIKEIDEEGYTIKHLCNSNAGSSGCPIINSLNFLVIGIHKGAQKHGNYNLGTFLKKPIKEFIVQIKSNINEKKFNEINKYFNKEKEKQKILDIQKKNNENFDTNKLNKKFNKKENEENIEKKKTDEILIQYKIDKIDCEEIKLFGDKFVENNKEKCQIIINGEEFKICSTKKNIQLNNIFQIKLKGITNITDMSYMFDNCLFLTSLPDISNMNTQNVTNMKSIFSHCTSLSSLPDISKWNTENVIDMSSMFNHCISLLSLPDISNWNIQNVKNMSKMFTFCKSLASFPELKKWNTGNVENMSYMFSFCNLIPDISNWKTEKVNDMSYMFSGCKLIPDISKLNTTNVRDMKGIFKNCNKLSSLPDISEWNTQNVENMSSIFEGCSSLNSLPDISKWNTQNVKYMNEMFEDCKSIKTLPDISKWDTQNVENMSSMFSNCELLLSLSDISKWNTKNVTKLSYMFYNCKTLSSLPNISKWNIKKVEYSNSMFLGCDSKLKIPKFKKGCIMF